MKLPIDLDTKTQTFLCTWNDGEKVEVHTKESLFETYKDTNLYDSDELFEVASDWAWLPSSSYPDPRTFEEYLKNSEEFLGIKFICDNMTITRISKMFTKLIALSHQALLLSDDLNWGSEEQVNAENSFFDEASTVAEKMGIVSEFETHCSKLDKADAEELISFTMNFFLNHKASDGDNVDCFICGSEFDARNEGELWHDKFICRGCIDGHDDEELAEHFF